MEQNRTLDRSIPQGGTGACPWESIAVICKACGSTNFGIDAGDRRGNSIPGRCDDCGGTKGKFVGQSAFNQLVTGIANTLRR